MREKIIPYSRQNIDYRDINSVQKVLKSDYLTTGPQIKKFENDKIITVEKIKNE